MEAIKKFKWDWKFYGFGKLMVFLPILFFLVSFAITIVLSISFSRDVKEKVCIIDHGILNTISAEKSGKFLINGKTEVDDLTICNRDARTLKYGEEYTVLVQADKRKLLLGNYTLESYWALKFGNFKLAVFVPALFGCLALLFIIFFYYLSYREAKYDYAKKMMKQEALKHPEFSF